ncbi:MAG: hypothetical protein JWR84_1751 [Caulobacter sp.]|nr:hypothetical protein [Caulobacter sp.]
MDRPALLTLALALTAGAAMAATPVDRLAPLQGDWPNGGSVVSIKGSSARVSRLSAEDRKAGYSDGDILVQGLAYQRVETLNNGDKRQTFGGTCRTPTAGRKGTTWVVSDCTLQLTRPKDGGPTRLVAVNGSDLIGGKRGAAPGQQTAVNRSKTEVADARVLPPPPPPPPPPEPPKDPNDTWSRRTMSAEELAAQDAGTRRLNADINARNAAIEARNKKADADFKAAQAARDAQIKASKAAYAKEMADYQARVAAQEAASAKAQADWQAAVKACKAGDKTQCAQPAPK